MIFSWDGYSTLEYPEVYLADANKNYKYDGVLHTSNLITELYFNNISKVSFDMNKIENGKPSKVYDSLAIGQLVEVKYIGWFQIGSIELRGSGKNETKSITALSLENELCSKRLTSFGQLGYEDHWDGGLDLYCLYNPSDKKHSILHIVTEKCPAWKIGHIDSDILEEYRSFSADEIDAYSFLTDNAADAFQCIFQFDTFTQTINAYTLKNYGKLTDLYFSYENLIRELNITCDISDIRTVFYVTGGDDRSTSTLNIIEVNPNGTSYIYDFSYFKQFMTPKLRDKLTQYEAEYAARVNGFTDKVNQLQSLYEAFTELKMRVPINPDSMNWNEYGLDALESELAKYNSILSQYANYSSQPNSAYLKQRYDETYNIIYGFTGNYSSSLKYALEKRRSEVSSKESQIASQKSLCESSSINLRDFLGEDLFIELSRYVFEESFNDSTFLATDTMTDSEILEMKKALRDYAFEKLAEVSQPHYTLTVNTLNVASIPQFRYFAEQMYLGDIATLELSDGTCVEQRMLKFTINWDTKDFEIVFSNKNHLEDGYLRLQEVKEQAQGTSSSLSIGGFGWNSAKNKKSTFDEYMQGVLDTAKQTLQNSSNQEFKIDNTGALLRRWMYEKNDYSPNQMWLTNNGIYLSNDSFRNVGMAIGEGQFNGENVYGIWADLLCGKMVLTKTLYIENKDSQFRIDNDGLFATNGVNDIRLNPHNSNGLFEIYKNGVKKMYFNSSGDLWLSGTMEASEVRSSRIYNSFFECTNGMNTITIDPSNNNRLFEIKRGNTPQIYFNSNGDAVFEGHMTVGEIYSKNYKESNETKGTMINLMNGEIHSHGEYSGEWLNNKVYNNTPTTTRIMDGYLQIINGNGKNGTDQDLFFTPFGISTNKDAKEATGVIEFLSKVYGDDHWGITIQTGGSPVALRSKSSTVLIHPYADSANNLFRFANMGSLYYGNVNNSTYVSGIHFTDDGISIIKDFSNGSGINASGNIKCNELNAKSGTIGGKVIAVKQDLDSLVTEWQALSQTSYNNGYSKGRNDGYNSGYSSGYSNGYSAGLNADN